MTRWDYRLIHRSREFAGFGKRAQSWTVEMEELLPELGREGWELVAVSSSSSWTGDAYAGLTTDEEWVFKRPVAEGD